MKKLPFLPLLLLLVLSSGLAWGAQAKVKFPSDVQLKVPKLLKGLAAAWIIPPDLSRPATHLNYSFAVDNAGNPWMGINGQYVSCPIKHVIFGTSEVFTDIGFLDNGGMILGTAHGVGYASKKTKVFERTQGVFPFMEVMSLLRFNLDGVRVFTATGKGFYIAGLNPQKKKYEIYYILADPKNPVYDLLLKTDFMPDAVTGNGDLTFLAKGKALSMIKDKKLSVLPAGLTENVRDLAFSENFGLFYATGSGVGYVFQKKYGVNFLLAKDCSIRIHGVSLYVLVPGHSAVLRVNPLDVFHTK
jgi:hypothetical protein